MRRSLRVLLTTFVLGLLAGSSTLVPHVAHGARSPMAAASPLPRFTAAELLRLQRGLPVHRPHYLTPRNTRVLGTLSYVLVKARPEQVVAVLLDARTLERALPKTRRVALIESKPGHRRFELTQGSRWAHATFTLVARHVSAYRVQFQLDRTRPHDLDDAWGWLEARPFDKERTLLTLAVAVDMGSGPLRWVFGGIVQKQILSAPESMKREAEQIERRQAARGRLSQRARPQPGRRSG